jgi:hypothetical protein
MKSEKVPFVYTEFSEIITELEDLDLSIIQIQENLDEIKETYPQFYEFLYRRLNSYRNYIEAQRRAINGTQKYPFFKENTTNFEFSDTHIRFPEEIQKLITKIINNSDLSAIFNRDNTIANFIYSYLAFYGSVTQDILVKVTGMSLSTISRTLNNFLKENLITALPKRYKESRIYQLTSLSLNIISQILKADKIIFNWRPKFQEMLKELKKLDLLKSESAQMIKSKLNQLLLQISDFKTGSLRLEKAQKELKLSL